MASDHPELELVPYLRGELSADEHARVQRHLEDCVDCRASAASSAAVLSELARAVDEVHAPDWPSYRAELSRKLAERQGIGRDRRTRWRRPELRLPVVGWPSMALGAVAVVVLAIAIGLHRGAGLGPPQLDQLAMQEDMDGADVGLLANYRVVEHLDLLENYELIEHLDELGPGIGQNNEAPS
jgi:anti-sigma-K factor RskA